MRFSILIPVYNVESYLRECIDSVLNQTFPDFEVVIVDDGSTDSSGCICDQYADCDHRIEVIHQRNRGLLLARRAAIDEARGEYLLCLDSDDALRIDALEVLNSEICRTEADIICFQASREADFSVPYLDFGSLSQSILVESDGGVGRVRKVLASTHHLNQMVCKAFRHEIVDAGVDYSRYEGLQYGEDLFQVCVMFDRARSVSFIDDRLYYYRLNTASISKTLNRDKLNDAYTVRARLGEYAARWDASYSPLVHAVDCVEVLNYCVVAVNRLNRLQAIDEITFASCGPLLCDAVEDADLSCLSMWKRLAIRLLMKRHFFIFWMCFKILFFILHASSSKRGNLYE